MGSRRTGTTRQIGGRLLLSFALLAAVRTASAAPETIWQVGRFDRSSTEFRPQPDPTGPAQEVVFVAGRSDPAKDWFAFQPGTGNGRAGARAHPFTIEFDLVGNPDGAYALRLSLLAYSPRLPWLEVSINGHRGWFYQHPKLSYEAGDPWVFYLPHYSTSEVRCGLPSRFLTAGKNRIVLTALDPPDERDDSQPYGFPFAGSSGIVYDAIALEHERSPAETPPPVAASLEPTIFYKRSGAGLVEIVDAFVRFERMPVRGRVTLALGERSLTREFTPGREFGEEKVSFEAPDGALARETRLIVEADGRTTTIPAPAAPAKKWTLLLTPNIHLDIGYSDSHSKVAELHSRTVDEAMDLAGRYPEFRFNLDGSWIVEQFLNGRDAAQRERFWKLVRAGKIAIPAVYASNFTGFQPVENLIRSLYYSRRLAAENQTPFDFSLLTDVPNASWSLASVMAAAGLKYFVVGSDSYRAPFLLYNRFHEQSPQWWEGPDGGRILTLYSRHYHQMGSLFGMPPGIGAGRDALPRFLQMYERPEYRSDAAIVFGSQVENAGLFPEQARLASEWNALYVYPRLEYAAFSEAMARVAAAFGGSIPAVRGDGGPYWEDGMIANAALTASVRESAHRILAAETFSTVSAAAAPGVQPPLEALANAWKNLLLTDEHSWQSDRSVTDPESFQSLRQGDVKDARGGEAKRQIDFSLGRSLAAISDRIDAPPGTLVVFNPLSWKRSALVEVDIENGLEVFDSMNNQAVAVEVTGTSRSYRRVRFVAEDVPSVGYTSYTLRKAATAGPVADAGSRDGTLESPYYRVVLDPDSGAVRSILDKELNRELVDSSHPYRFNQYLYVTGADELPNRLVQFSTVSPLPKLEVHPAAAGRVVSVAKTPFGSVARLASSATNTPAIETQILLFDREKRIEFVNRIRKAKVYTKEAAYFAFPFALPQPRFRYETQNGFVDPARDLLPGAGREWFNVQHWIGAEQDGFAVTLVPVDAPMAAIGDIVRGTWPAEFGRRSGTIYSYIMSNYTPEGYPAGQGGEFVFRYALTSARAFEPVEAGRFGRAAMSPLEVNEIRTNDKSAVRKGSLDARQSSFLELDQPNVVLLTWKTAEDGKGSILRLLEIAGRATNVKVRTPLMNTRQAWTCNAVEDNVGGAAVDGGAVAVELRPFEIRTVRVVR